ncbi:MAG: SDR family oxidoreductase [Desulfatibacillaceae bacterium]|nr:SDR family oxidoreductase [Desulfatibacillaceae bacterium]
MASQKPLTGKVALVTGASRGLGAGIALALGDAGADVAVTDLLVEGAQEDPLSLVSYSILAAHFARSGGVHTLEVCKKIEEMGVQSRACKMDVTCPDEICQVVADIEAQWGGIDILVNNAGVMDNFALLEKQNPDMWERDLKVNLSGAFNCIRAVWPGMKKKKWGRIVNISSFVAQTGALAQPGYGASKAGLLGLSRSLALEGARHNITVNAVLPGFIDTEAVRLQDRKTMERITDRIAMKRLGQVGEVAAAVVFLAGPEASYITGAALPVAGGADLFVF